MTDNDSRIVSHALSASHRSLHSLHVTVPAPVASAKLRKAQMGPWPSMAQHGPAWPSMAQHGPAWPSMAQHGPAWPSMAQHGPAWPSILGGADLIAACSMLLLFWQRFSNYLQYGDLRHLCLVFAVELGPAPNSA